MRSTEKKSKRRRSLCSRAASPRETSRRDRRNSLRRPFRNEVLKEELLRLLNQRDGLILGVCNGFQALIKLGLVPDGTIEEQKADSPTLTYNTIGRHVSKMVNLKVVSNKSPLAPGGGTGRYLRQSGFPWRRTLRRFRRVAGQTVCQRTSCDPVRR